MKTRTYTSTLRASLGLALLTGLALGGCKKTEDSVDPEPVDPTAKAEPEVVWPDEPFRAERPTPKPIKDVEIPKIESFTLANGLEVRLVKQQTLPTVMMFFEWDIGEVDDPRGKTGVASLCGDVLDEATANKDKAAFAAAQSDHAVSVWVSPGTETTNVGVRALKRELGPALDLTAEMLLEPGMRQEDFDRVRDQEKAWIEQRKGSPSSVAYRIYASLIWGSQHPYGQIETDKSVDKIKLSDCKKWAKKLKPGGARLWVVGQVNEQELREELDARFAKWSGKAPKPKTIKGPKPAAGTIFFVHVPNAAQSQILMGHPGPARDAEDYEATMLMAAIVGGSFSSRINMNLREDKGWAYGARGGFAYRRGGSYFNAGSSVRSDVTAQAASEILGEIQNMRTSDPTAVELEREQNGALLSMPADFSTATRTLFAFRNLEFHSLPLDWHEGHQTRLRAVDTAAVRAAAQTHLQADGHVVLIVGDGAAVSESGTTVLEDLEKLAADGVFGKGGIQYLDTDGNPVERPKLDKADAPAKSG